MVKESRKLENSLSHSVKKSDKQLDNTCTKILQIDLERYIIDPLIIELIPEHLARKYVLIAIDIRNNLLIVAMKDPLNIFAIDDLKLITGYNIKPVMASEEHILKAIDDYYREEITKTVLREFEESYVPISFDEIDEEEVENLKSAPVVKLVNSIINQAIKMNASDIHIEPFSEEIRVRFRIDGDLQSVVSLPKTSLSAVITRIKIMGRMNIAENRIPQDGRVEYIFEEREIDMRISTLPTIYGEKAVIRLLDRNSFMIEKEQLGFSHNDLEIFNKILKQPYGMILVTGPTGSGTKLR